VSCQQFVAFSNHMTLWSNFRWPQCNKCTW